MDKYEFNREFRLKILALCLDDLWMSKYGDEIIKPEYFERDEEESFIEAIGKFRSRYKRSPHDPMDVIELCDGEHSTFILDIYELEQDWDLSLASDYAVEFAQEQAAKLAILEGVDDIAKGDIQAAIDRMKKALEVGQNLESPGIDPIMDVNSWLFDCYAAAGLAGGRNVVHISHEMNAAQVAKRYAARMIFRFPKRKDDLYEYAEELVDAARKLLKGRIRIISGKKSTTEIENHLERLRAEGFDFGLIIDDYPDLIQAPRNYTERRFELSAVYTWLREVAEMHDCPVWGASQGNRATLSKEIITIQDIAEDIGKASIADIIISICQTYDEEQLNQARLFMAKVRDGHKHALIRCKWYGEQQAIISTGYVTYKKKKDGEERDV
jgi:tetratricopeptide (TPR) repeat protein